MRDGSIEDTDRGVDDREDRQPGHDCSDGGADRSIAGGIGEGEVSEGGLTRIVDVTIPREEIVGVQTYLLEGIASGTLVDTVNDQPLQHSFIPGAYARAMLILKGTLIVGKIHRNPCFNFIMRGWCTVFSEDGVKDIVAPFFFTSTPGAKRIVFAREETLWITCHGTQKTDLAEIEEELISPSYDDLIPGNVVEYLKEMSP